jgi:hypothetical protein
MEPQATKVPAEKKDIKSDKPPMNQGTASPPAKKDLRLRPVRAKSKPMPNTKAEKMKMMAVSM